MVHFPIKNHFSPIIFFPSTVQSWYECIINFEFTLNAHIYPVSDKSDQVPLELLLKEMILAIGDQKMFGKQFMPFQIREGALYSFTHVACNVISESTVFHEKVVSALACVYTIFLYWRFSSQFLGNEKYHSSLHAITNRARYDALTASFQTESPQGV